MDEATGSLPVMSAVDMVGVRMGDHVAVQGVGLIGLGIVAACFLRGEGSRPIAINVIDKRLELAREFGVRAVINPNREDVTARVRAITGMDGADMPFEGTGVRSLID